MGDTYTSVVRVPAVENCELVSQSRDNRDLLLGIVAHNLLNEGVIAVDLLPVQANLLVNKASHGRLQRAVRNRGIIRSKGRVELNVIAVYRVIGIVQDRVIVSWLGADAVMVRIGDIQRVAEWPLHDGVVQALNFLATKEVVDGAVLHDKPDNGLDLVLEVGDGALGASIGAGLDRAGADRAGQRSGGSEDNFSAHLCN